MKESIPPTALNADQLVGQWVLDSSASEVRFGNRTMWGLSPVKGQFKAFSGEGIVEPDGRVSGWVHLEAASIDTKNGKRDAHLRSADFFDVERYPTITVQVTSATLHGADVEMVSSLEVRGVREPLHLTSKVQEAAPDQLTLTAEGTVDRKRFGMSWNRLGMITGLTTVSVNALFRRGVH